MKMSGSTGTGGLLRGAAALVAALIIAAGAASGAPAAAAARPGGAGGPRSGLTAGVISTVAGGVGGPAKATTVALLTGCGVSFGAGYLHIGDGAAVRAVSPSTDRLTTPAGTGAAGPVRSGGPAPRATLEAACGTVVDHSGNLLIADWHNGRIRVVAAHTGTFYGQAMFAGDIYRIAGTGKGSFSGDGGPATQAELSEPFGVAVDAAGNVLIADSGNDRIRVVAARTGTFYGQAMTAGDIYTVAGTGGLGFSGDGGPAVRAELQFPQAVAVDAAGNLLISDTLNNRIRVVAARTGTFYGQAMTAGDIYTVAGGGTNGLGDGGPATAAVLANPAEVSLDAAGNLVIADTVNNRLRVVAHRTGTFYGKPMTGGDIYTVAGTGTRGFSGDGGPATSAELFNPSGVAVDAAGNLLIADAGNTRVRAVAARTGTFYGQAMTAGDMYTVAGTGTQGFSGDGGPATSAELHPFGMGVDAAGNLLIAEFGNIGFSNNRIGVVARSTGTFYGQPMTAGDIYSVAGEGASGFSGDGGPATSAKLNAPLDVAADAAGNLVIADSNNNRIRMVAARTGTFYGQPMKAGDIYTVAGGRKQGFSGDGGPATSAELSLPQGVAVDAAGNLLIADTGNARIRVVARSSGTFYGQPMTAGDIYTVAGGGTNGLGDGGPATSAELANPAKVAADAAGNLVIADTFNDRIRVVAATSGAFYGQAMQAGDIYTVAGNGTAGFSGDGGPATSAELSLPLSVAVDAAGNLVIADLGNYRVRVVARGTGTFYGQPMTAGDIYTVAGDGTPGFSGDGGRATKTELADPSGVTVDAAGNLVIADTGNNRIRMVRG